jgi:hypothetical protein
MSLYRRSANLSCMIGEGDKELSDLLNRQDVRRGIETK